MSKSETPPWHQCKSEMELRYEIADEIFNALSAWFDSKQHTRDSTDKGKQ